MIIIYRGASEGDILAGFEIQLTPKSCALKTESSLHPLVPLLKSYGRSLFSAVLSEMATAKCERTRNSDVNKLWSGNSVSFFYINTFVVACFITGTKKEVSKVFLPVGFGFL